jgi:murein DD-endopeptidase MepM/ murein hydrolase activator NlpD
LKKFDFKTRMQLGWLKAALLGVAAVVLIAPAAGTGLGISDSEEALKENPVLSAISSISFGPKVKVMINGDIVALAKSEEEAYAAYKTARLAYNAKGVRILDVNISCAEVDKEKDAEAIKGMRVLKDDKLSDAILDSLGKYGQSDKKLAYTMRIDDYTVTLKSMEDLVSILEQAQGEYDVEDSFQVGLKPPASHNVTMYEVKVEEKAEKASKGGEDTKTTEAGNAEQATEQTEEQTSAALDESGIISIPEKQKVLLTGAEGTDASKENEQSTEQQAETAKGEQSTEQQAETAEGEQTTEQQDTTEGEQTTEQKTEDVSAQAADDGVKYVGFSEKIQVMETYVGKDQIKDRDTAFSEITAENDEESIYVVEPGDCLSIIAEKNNMSIDEIKELNPDIESDDDIYYDDRLNVTVPKAAVQILVEKQETYEEEYNAEVVYEDDNSMYIGETEVVQEGVPGKHIVTDLVTYKGDTETDREQLEENVQVAAVAQIVKRGTKSKPTYMFPVTNWNVTSNFGYRWGRLHAGTDVGVPIGTTVRASRGGQVITAGWVGGYGNCVIIDHGDGVATRYGHLSEVTVSVGQYVDQGEQIALSGNTGRSTGPHLHFEIRINGEAVDPLPYLYQTAE